MRRENSGKGTRARDVLEGIEIASSRTGEAKRSWWIGVDRPTLQQRVQDERLRMSASKFAKQERAGQA